MPLLKRPVKNQPPPFQQAVPKPVPPPPMQAAPSNPLATFGDKAGRVWLLVIDLPTIRRIHQYTGENLALVMLSGEGGAQQALGQLIIDPIRLSGVLWAALEPDATAAAISDADFFGALKFRELQQAGPALIEALADFFDQPLCDLLKQLAAFGRQQIAQGQTIAMAAMEKLRQQQTVTTKKEPPAPPSSSKSSGESSPVAELPTSEAGDSAS